MLSALAMAAASSGVVFSFSGKKHIETNDRKTGLSKTDCCWQSDIPQPHDTDDGCLVAKFSFQLYLLGHKVEWIEFDFSIFS
jgi:hypothetical protein